MASTVYPELPAWAGPAPAETTDRKDLRAKLDRMAAQLNRGYATGGAQIGTFHVTVAGSSYISFTYTHGFQVNGVAAVPNAIVCMPIGWDGFMSAASIPDDMTVTLRAANPLSNLPIGINSFYAICA